MSIGNTRRTLTALSFAPNDVVTATGNETGVDLLDYEGDITLILDAEAGGLTVNTDEIKRYARAVITVAGGTGAGAVSVVALGRKKYN
jgi:hypothetical protein